MNSIPLCFRLFFLKKGEEGKEGKERGKREEKERKEEEEGWRKEKENFLYFASSFFSFSWKEGKRNLNFLFYVLLDVFLIKSSWREKNKKKKSVPKKMNKKWKNNSNQKFFVFFFTFLLLFN